MEMEDRMGHAIVQACKAMKRRYKLEEGAYVLAVDVISHAENSQATLELEEKVKSLQFELNQNYQKHSQVSEKVVEVVLESQSLRLQLRDKETAIRQVHEELRAAKENPLLVELIANEMHGSLETSTAEKLQDAERLNDANAAYEDMSEKIKSGQLMELARSKVDGIVRHSEAGAEDFVESELPSVSEVVIRAHDGVCSAIQFEQGGNTFFSGGHDKLVKSWNVATGSYISTLRGCLGSILDLSLSHHNGFVIAACSDHKLHLWESQTGQMRHTLTGHSEKVVSVDVSKTSNRRVVSAAYDRTMKTWDMQTGYATNTLICYSYGNAVALTMSGEILCSGHMDGNLRLWDISSGKQSSQVFSHNYGITSVSISREGYTVLTSGRDNVHNTIDVRTLEVHASFRAPGHFVATNWSRSCLSPDEKYVAAGGADGSVAI
uniref:Autophagy-related protein 16 domain-containing protein n=1 Tax=Physcomitrium patens TaxID=3218 RepID=A0A7I4FC03_PHYPA